ncbi:MAG: peroxiredoxin family protein [Pirellulales bacterium]
MKRTTHSIASLAVFALLACLPGLAQADDLKAGDDAPDFSLQGTDGETHALKDYHGKQVVVVAWFPKAKTGGCTKECKSLKESGKALREFDVAYFTASCDTPEFNKEFATELGLDYPILSDPTKGVAKAYGVVHEGREVPERWTFYIGTDGKLLHIDKEMNTDGHGAEIAAKLKELGVKQK